MKKKLFLLIALLLCPLSVFAANKTETIYTNLDLNGKVIKSNVNTKLTNLDNTSYEDYTLLNKITNINGEEKFTLNNNRLTWEAKGKDICYQAPNTLEQPITIKTNYYLNNELVNVKDIKNKKGNIKIEVLLQNNSYNSNYGMYNPYVVVLATTLNNKYNSNIEVSNGEIIDNGKTSAIAAIASPGMYDNLKIDELKDLDKITITYKTTKFEEKELYVAATPKLLEEIDISKLSKLDNLSSSINLLQENMNKIESGSNELTSGTTKIKEGSTQIANNLETVVSGVNSLKEGANSLDGALNQILQVLNSQIEEMNKSYYDESGNPINPFEDVDKLVAGDNQAIESLQNLNKTFAENFTKSGLDITKSEEELTSTLSAMLQAGYIDEQTMTNLLTYKKLYDGNNQNIYLYNKNIEGLNALKGTITESSTKIQTLTKTLSGTLSQVEAGASSIDNGLTSLGTGLDKLYQGALSLEEGTNELNNGANTLSNGIKEFNDQGIKKLSNYASIINNYTNKAKILAKMSNEYNGYSTNNANKTIFIYKIK